jgi:hypothetical protein
MTTRNSTRILAAIVAVLCAVSTASIARADRAEHYDHYDHAHEHYDARFNHNHAYPVRGYSVAVLPQQHYEVVHAGAHYFYSGGVWYAPRGPSFVVVAPPVHVFVPVLPAFYTTVWVGGLPYYYANDTYYVWRQDRGYEVVDPPDQQAASTEPPQSDNVFIYPNNGQSEDQQARDRYECHRWAASETGFDPTAAGGGEPPQDEAGKRVDYNRAMGACLEGRGYTVR